MQIFREIIDSIIRTQSNIDTREVYIFIYTRVEFHFDKIGIIQFRVRSIVYRIGYSNVFIISL